jgi:hypothetical protein
MAYLIRIINQGLFYFLKMNSSFIREVDYHKLFLSGFLFLKLVLLFIMQVTRESRFSARCHVVV